MKLPIPDIDLDTLSMHPDVKNIKNYKEDKFVRILNLILEKTIPNNYYHDIFSANIHSNNFKDIANNYKDYILILIKENIIVSGPYLPNHYSKGYSFAPMCTHKIKLINIKGGDRINKRKENKEEKKNKNIEENGNAFLEKWFNSSLKIDGKKAEEFCQKLFEQRLINPTVKLKKSIYIDKSTHKPKKGKAEEVDQNPKDQARIEEYNIAKLRERDFNISRDGNVMRIYSNLTNLKKEYRNFITYGNKNLISIDISNSQPFLTLALFNTDFWSSVLLKNPTLNLSKSGLANLDVLNYADKIYCTNKDYSKYNEIVKAINSKGKDYELFKKAVTDGYLYKMLQNKFNEVLDAPIKDYKKLKDTIFTVLFSDNRFISGEDAKLKKIFKQLFPTVYEVFSRIKKNNKEILACILQRLESYIIIDKIVPRISIEHPTVPIFTIHDSIVTTVGNEELVKGIMAEEVLKITGYTPTFKLEEWKEENAIIE